MPFYRWYDVWRGTQCSYFFLYLLLVSFADQVALSNFPAKAFKANEGRYLRGEPLKETRRLDYANKLTGTFYFTLLFSDSFSYHSHNNSSHPMTSADCFEVARAVYNFREFKNTISWSMEALRKFREENNTVHTMTESEIIEYIVFSHFFIG